MPRCTDEKLFQLCRDFEEHKNRFTLHEQREIEKFDRIIQAQERNTQAIGELTIQVSDLVGDTRDIVQLHRDFQGVARVGTGVQAFSLWCLKWGGILGALGISINWIVEHFSKHPPG